MNQKEIVALAILKTNYDEGKDYIDSFVPMIGDCIRELNKTAVTISEIQSKVDETFKLYIPQGAIKTILNRLKKKGYITRKESSQYMIDLKKVRINFNIYSKRENNEREFNNLLQNLKGFSDKHEIFKKQNFSKEELKNTLLGYFNYQHYGNIDNNLPSMVIGQFITHITSSEPEIFKYFEKIYLGHAIANALYYYQDTNKINEKLSRLTIYLDTPILLRALGYSSEQNCTPILELIKILRKNNIRLRYFTHTLYEAQDLITAASHVKLENKIVSERADIIKWLVENESSSDIFIKNEELENDLKKNGIIKKNTPTSDSNFLSEIDITKDLKETFPYMTDIAISKDIDSITSIYNLRNAQECDNLPDCSYIFLISNSKLFSIFKKLSRKTPLCILVSDLASFLWFSGYSSKTSTLSKEIIYADAYTLMQPSEKKKKKYKSALEKIQNKNFPEGTIEHFMTNKDLFNELYEETGGSIERFPKDIDQKIQDHFSQNTKKITEQLNNKIKLKDKKIGIHIKKEVDKLKKKNILRYHLIFWGTSFVLILLIAIIGWKFGITINQIKEFFIWFQILTGVGVLAVFYVFYFINQWIKNKLIKTKWIKNKLERAEKDLEKSLQ